MGWSVAIVALSVALAVALAACGGGRAAPPAKKDQAAPPEAITKVTEEGPVKATVKVWPASPALGDPIHLELTIVAQPGVMAAAPFESERLGRFTVAGWSHDTSRRDDGAAIEVQRYTLQAPGSGKHRLPPIRVAIDDGRGALAGPATAGADAGVGGAATAPVSAGPTELLTEEVPLSVAMVDATRATQDLAPARGPLDASTRDTRWIWLVVGAVALLLVAGGAWFGLRGVRRARDRRARISAYEVAVRRLAELEQRGAPDDAAADAWFVELSAIVRNYLEGRYQVRAPELTTEEFLQEARRAAGGTGLSSEHRDLLTAFLERCDRVKFAGYRPDAEESLATLKAARAFVEDTRLKLPEAS